MRPIPDFLPPENSRKWHVRRKWDGFGYFRVRSLALPGYSDWPRLLGYLKDLRPGASAAEASVLRDLADEATARVHDYVRAVAGVPMDQREAAWDTVLDAVDAVLAEQDRLRTARGA